MKFVVDINVEKYDSFVKSNNNCNIFQSPQWVKVKEDSWDYRRVAVEDIDSNILATAQILVRQGLWYLPRGPIMDYRNKELLQFFLAELKRYAKKEKAKLLKIDIPEYLKEAKLSDFPKAQSSVEAAAILDIFKHEKFQHKGFTLAMSDTIQPRFEVVSDLSANFFDTLPKDTRRLIRDAEKKCVVVKKRTVVDLDDFMYALECTEKRKGITLRKKEYFEKMFELYGDDVLLYVSYIDLHASLVNCEERLSALNTDILSLRDKAPKKKRQLEEQVVSVEKLQVLFTELASEVGSKGEQIISASFTLVYGNYAEMIYAGMDERFLKLPAQYKVYEQSMLTAQQKGVTKFSTGGIEGTLDDSLLLFKSKFNPNVVEHYGEFDYTFSYMYKFMYEYGLPLRRKILKLIKR